MTPVEQIKEKLNLVDFIKGYVELRPAGKNHKGLCPFHSEKTPSFMVSPDRQIWRCFGCGEGGDIFKFLMRHDNLEFYEALQVLAEKAGVDIKKGASADQRQFNTLYDIVNTAKDIFKAKLRDSKEAIEYLKGRNLTGETVAEFEVGFAPKSSDQVTIELVNRGFRIEDVVRAGLAIKTERGKFVDRFRNRIMFPIHNHFGKVVGFSGRIMPGETAADVGKYINTPETPIFRKSRVLYGFWQSKKPIRQSERALLVEGQTDFLMLWQRGIKNVVATSGTALTGDHLQSLGKVASGLVVAFDKDDAGLRAGERVIDMAGSNDFNVSVLDLGEFEDPAEAAQKDIVFLEKALEGASPAMLHYFTYYLTDKALSSIAGKKGAIRDVLSKIAALSSGVERSHWLRELSYKVGIPEKELAGEMEMLGAVGSEEVSAETPTEEIRRELSRKELIAERMLHIASVRDDLRETIAGYVHMLPEIYSQIYKAIQEDIELGAEAKQLMEFISLYPDFEGGGHRDGYAGELAVLLRELELEHLNEIKNQLSREVLLAERSGDADVLGKKLKEFDDVTRKMQDIRHAKGV